MTDLRRLVLLPVLIASASLVAASAPAQVPEPRPMTPPPDVVVTTGEHVLRAAPDIAYVTVVAESRAMAPREAQTTNATTMAAVQAKLKGAGIAEEAMRTRSVDLQPEYDYLDGRQVLRSYVARNVLEVRVEPLARVGEITDIAVGVGATRVEGLRFDLKDRADLERQALTRAVEDAIKRATAIATGAGRTVGAVLRIEDAGVPDRPQPRPYFAGRMSAEAVAAPPPTPVQPGEMDVRASVTVTVRLQ